MNTINLPVSLGEALDKLTILDIKKEKITDERLKDVEKEYSILYENLKIYIEKFKFYYNILRKINLDIWEMQDDFKYKDCDKIKLCIKVIEYNDRRFRVKKKINNITNSVLKEQKGYKLKKAFVLTHLGLGDNINSIGMVTYLSTCYDEVVVVCKEHNKVNCELFYQDNDSVKLYSVPNDESISPTHGFNMDKFKEITKEHDLYMCGGHSLGKKISNFNELPFSFYEQVDLEPQIFWDYFYIPVVQDSLILYQKIKDINYIFIHSSTSAGPVFTTEYVEKNFNLDRNVTLFINPNNNCYNKEHKFYEIANKFIGHKLIFYVDTIKNANYNILTDSSFFCIAINLELKNDNNYYISRFNVPYVLYNDKFKFKNVNRKVFKLIK